MGLVAAQGAVRYRGRDIAGLRPIWSPSAGIGYVPEDRQVFPTLTRAAESGNGPEAGGQVRPLDFRRRVPAVSQPGGPAAHPAGVLSGGEQQMLTMCRTLMGDPDLILIDEPTEGLAPMLVEQVGVLLAEIARRGVAILLVEQKLTIALKISLAALRHGPWPDRVSTGTPAELAANPAVRREWLEV